jgi:hypothetical protein
MSNSRHRYFFSSCVALLTLVSQLQVAPVLAGGDTADTAAKPSSTSNFSHFRKETDGWKILADPEVKKKIKVEMGTAAGHYWDCTQLTNEPQVSGDDILVTAGVRGLFTFMESFLNLNVKTGSVIVGYLNDKHIYVYGTTSIDTAPKPLQDYIKNLEKENTLVYEKPSTTLVAVTPPTKKKTLSLATVTGTYERCGADRFNQSSIDVRALPNGKIKFDIEAGDGGHTGSAQGEAPLVNNLATYKQDTSKIKMQFNGKYVTISGNDETFCGMGVTLLGKYQKTKDTPPKFSF